MAASTGGGSSELTNTLLAACRADPSAEARLREWSSGSSASGQSFGDFALALAVEIGSPHQQRPPEVRQMAALYLKNLLYAKDTLLVKQNQERWWKQLSGEQRHFIKRALLESMASVEPSAAHAAALAASEIAAVELPYQQWNEFVPTLMERVTLANNASSNATASTNNPQEVQLAALECLGYTAERIADLELQLGSTGTVAIANTTDPLQHLQQNLGMPCLASAVVDQMLTTIVDGVQPSRNDALRLAAITALRNSLGFVRKNMSNKAERDFIFNAICEATRCAHATVRQLAFSCLDQIAENYYEFLQDYMTVLFQLTTEAVRQDQDENVKMAALEFWSTVGFVEAGLLEEEREAAADLNANQDNNNNDMAGASSTANVDPAALVSLLQRPLCPKYTASAMETLVPLLLDTLTKQEDDLESSGETWNLQAAGAVCLETISSTVEAAILPLVMPFVEQNINNNNDNNGAAALASWRYRDAAIVAFASILDGPDTSIIQPFIVQAIPILLQAFHDPQHIMVRDSAVHCIGKICKLHIAAVLFHPELVHSILQALLQKLHEPSPLVAAHACSAIFNVATSIKQQQQEQQHALQQQNDDDNAATTTSSIPDTNVLSATILPLLQGLLQVTDREDSVEANLRISALSAATELVSTAAMDAQPIFCELLPFIIQRLDAALHQTQVLSKDDAEHKEVLLGLLCGLISVLFQRMDKQNVSPPMVDHVMNLLLEMIQSQNKNVSGVIEEALTTVGSIAGTMDDDFAKYMPAFMPFLIQGLKSFQEQSICNVSVGLLVDVCSAVGSRIQPYCDEIMKALKEALEDPSVSREIKPMVIACFGDIAMAICAAYEPYLKISVMMLMQAASQSAPPDDDELVAFINSLRLSILDAYSGIIIGMADGNAADLFAPNLESIMVFLQFLARPDSNRDEDVLVKAVALIGDICQRMGNQPLVQQCATQPFIAQLVQEAMADPASQSIAYWTATYIQQVLQQQQ